MSILQKAVEISATLDPTLGLELEQEFGADWQEVLSKEIAVASNGGVILVGPEFRGIYADVFALDQSEVKEKYSVREVRAFADELGLPIKAGAAYIGEADLIVSIYKALGQE